MDVVNIQTVNPIYWKHNQSANAKLDRIHYVKVVTRDVDVLVMA